MLPVGSRREALHVGVLWVIEHAPQILRIDQVGHRGGDRRDDAPAVRHGEQEGVAVAGQQILHRHRIDLVELHRLGGGDHLHPHAVTESGFELLLK